MNRLSFTILHHDVHSATFCHIKPYPFTAKLLDGGKTLDADLITLGLACANAIHIGHQDGLIIFVCFHEFVLGWLHAPQPVSRALFWHL